MKPDIDSCKHRYEIHPTKTSIIDFVKEYKQDDSTWTLLGENETATHLGITRAGKKD